MPALFDVRVPCLFQRAVCQINSLGAECLSGLSFIGVERGDTAVSEVAVCAGGNHRQIQFVIDERICDSGGVFFIDLGIVVHLDTELDIVRYIAAESCQPPA